MSLLLPIWLALAAAAPDGGAHHDHGPRLGKVSFETTCSAAAHGHFEQGLGWLHSFEYQRAAESFTRAAAADPGCAIAHWGVGMSYYHPLWAPPTATELEQGTAALARAKAAGAKSQRERDYVAALDAFYGESEQTDHKTRALAYSDAMASLHKRYPGDREAAVFYALSLVAAGTMDDDPDFSREKQAAGILNHVLAENPDHPGVAHYLIHSFDYPSLAELALPAARRYATIAPDSAHAQHMPSHIFTRLGLWDEAIKSNRAAAASAQAYAKAAGVAGAWDQRLHAMDYLTYAYLQTGRDKEARAVFEELKRIGRAEPPSPTVAYAATAIPARVLLEQRDWDGAVAFELPRTTAGLAALVNHRWAIANIHFAKAVGAARAGKTDAAREEISKLAAIEQALTIKPGDYDWRKQIAIARGIAEGWLAFASGKTQDAERLMRAAADLDDATEKHPVTPGAVLPAREQLAELLAELGEPGEAVKEFEASLARAPRRLASLYGAARAAKLAGDQARSARYYAELAELTKESDSTRPEVQEARNVAAQLAGR